MGGRGYGFDFGDDWASLSPRLFFLDGLAVSGGLGGSEPDGAAATGDEVVVVALAAAMLKMVIARDKSNQRSK